jgi:hypothetical protein
MCGAAQAARGVAGRNAMRCDAITMLVWVQVVGKIYDGKVASVLDFGAFVGLEGVEGRREGLVHVSAMSSDRVLNPRSFVEKGQRVKVRYSTRVLPYQQHPLTFAQLDSHVNGVHIMQCNGVQCRSRCCLWLGTRCRCR